MRRSFRDAFRSWDRGRSVAMFSGLSLDIFFVPLLDTAGATWQVIAEIRLTGGGWPCLLPRTN